MLWTNFCKTAQIFSLGGGGGGKYSGASFGQLKSEVSDIFFLLGGGGGGAGLPGLKFQRGVFYRI